jgi:hypothetical protein
MIYVVVVSSNRFLEDFYLANHQFYWLWFKSLHHVFLRILLSIQNSLFFNWLEEINRICKLFDFFNFLTKAQCLIIEMGAWHWREVSKWFSLDACSTFYFFRTVKEQNRLTITSILFTNSSLIFFCLSRAVETQRY